MSPQADVIARIDDRDYRIALDQAQAQVEAAQASIENIDAQISGQQAQINAYQAQVEQAQAALEFAQQQATRYEHLAQTGLWQRSECASSIPRNYASSRRRWRARRTTLKAAQRQLESLKAQRSVPLANLAQAQAQRDQAQLNLSYTTVTAAQAGRVVNLTAAVGQFATAGHER